MSPSPSSSPSKSTSTSATPKPTHTVTENTTLPAKNAGDEEKLAKTGDGFVIPLMTAGIGLIVGGGITLRASRRGAYQ
ncbi:LPXTG cell wall anchor domain-containing protein [Sphaerisporangium sp. NPDC051011]|uniref:LPXTG cell wall anchor domain-containing protein n=1 Tax=Sphaerisporangium sp. NPDC051011 TaxID=3155792 RepID=UPI0033F29FA1